MRYRLWIAVAFVLLCAAGGLAQEAKKDGWWIKADPQKQKDQMIFYVGANKGSYGFWRVWNAGDPAEFDVPDEYKNGQTIFILAQTTSGKNCEFCLMYKTRGVKHFEFDLEVGQEAKQTDEDKACK